jgi:hypothetical protein
MFDIRGLEKLKIAETIDNTAKAKGHNFRCALFCVSFKRHWFQKINALHRVIQ